MEWVKFLCITVKRWYVTIAAEHDMVKISWSSGKGSLVQTVDFMLMQHLTVMAPTNPRVIYLIGGAKSVETASTLPSKPML